jgi:hypothetical protein
MVFNILYPSISRFLSRLLKPESSVELIPLCDSFFIKRRSVHGVFRAALHSYTIFAYGSV